MAISTIVSVIAEGVVVSTIVPYTTTYSIVLNVVEYFTTLYHISSPLLTMHLFFRPLDSAENLLYFSCLSITLKLWTFLSQTRPPPAKIFLDLLFFLTLSFLLQFHQKNCIDDPVPIAMFRCSVL